jgi:hypothetical protein
MVAMPDATDIFGSKGFHWTFVCDLLKKMVGDVKFICCFEGYEI